MIHLISMLFASLTLAFASFVLGYVKGSAPPRCDDCGARRRLAEKTDHHGGTKTVCTDRDACHRRGG